MEQLNLNLLRALAVLLEDRNVTKTSKRLNLTQSAISRQLSQLRDYFADPLLIREGNAYLLSARAKELLPKVQNILFDIDNLASDNLFEPAACTRSFSFGCTDYVAEYIFPDVLHRFQREAPNIDIKYQMWKTEWLDRLGTLPLDLIAIMAAKIPENLNNIYLGEDYPVCLMASGHPLAVTDSPELELLLNYPFVHLNSGGDKDSFFDRALEEQVLSRRILFEVPFFSAAFQVIAQSHSLMILPKHIACTATNHLSLTYRPLPLPVPNHSYHLCWHTQYDSDQAHTWVRCCIAEQIKKSIYSP